MKSPTSSTGWGVEKMAEALGIGTATVKRDWSFARAFLQPALDSAGDAP